jgi:hypothetical protein
MSDQPTSSRDPLLTASGFMMKGERKRGRPPKRLTQIEAATAPPDLEGLPPPGDALRDALKARTDELTRAAEELMPEREALDPSRYKPIREVQAMLQESILHRSITKALPEYEYCLVRYREPGSQVELKETQEVYDTREGCKVPVWEVVQGTMTEMLERRDVRGYRVIADTLLMRGRKDRVQAWRLHEKWLANRHHDQARSEVLDQARRTRGIRVVETEMTDPGMTVTQGVMRDALAKQLGSTLVTTQLKTGQVPGMELRG